MNFLGGTFFSVSDLPPVLKGIICSLPLTNASQCLLAAALDWPFPWPSLAVIVAWAIMFGRIMVWTAVLHPPLFRRLWPALAAGALAGLACGVYLHFSPRADEAKELEVKNPFELRPAITFGLLYGAILLAARAAQIAFGDMGVFVSSAAAGLADVDAITLSMAEMSRAGNVGLSTAEGAVVLAAAANTAVKGGIVFVSGSKELRRAILPGFLLILAATVAASFAF